MTIFVIVFKSTNKASREKPNAQEFTNAGILSHRINSNFFTSYVWLSVCYIAIIVQRVENFTLEVALFC